MFLIGLEKQILWTCKGCLLYFGIREQKQILVIENRFIVFQNIPHYGLYTFACVSTNCRSSFATLIDWFFWAFDKLCGIQREQIFFFLSVKCICNIECMLVPLMPKVVLWWFLFCFSAFFISEGQNTDIKKVYGCVYHLLRSMARSLLFRLQISSACFYNKKKFFFLIVLTLNANFLYYWPCSFNNVMFP